jgi:hypothetical protein
VKAAAAVAVDDSRPKGKHTFYPGKLQKPVTSNLTHEVHDAIARAEAGSEASRSDIQEHAMRKLAGLPVNPTLDALLLKVFKAKR